MQQPYPYGGTAPYQRPGSTVAYGSPAPPGYSGQQGYQPNQASYPPSTTTPVPENPGWGTQTGSSQSPPPSQVGWSQPGGMPQAQMQPQQQGAVSAYNPNAYGPMPGSHQQPNPSHSVPNTIVPSQSNQQFQQNTQHVPSDWAQQQSYTPQSSVQQYSSVSHPSASAQPQQQGGHAAFPTPTSGTHSQSSGSSFFVSSTGSAHIDPYQATPSPPTSQTGYQVGPQPGSLNPDESHPAYVPPSLSGQGVAAYMPANTNPQPGVYVPPPPDIPAWTPAQHAPLAGVNKRFKYVPPVVHPNYQTSAPVYNGGTNAGAQAYPGGSIAQNSPQHNQHMAQQTYNSQPVPAQPSQYQSLQQYSNYNNNLPVQSPPQHHAIQPAQPAQPAQPEQLVTSSKHSKHGSGHHENMQQPQYSLQSGPNGWNTQQPEHTYAESFSKRNSLIQGGQPLYQAQGSDQQVWQSHGPTSQQTVSVGHDPQQQAQTSQPVHRQSLGGDNLQSVSSHPYHSSQEGPSSFPSNPVSPIQKRYSLNFTQPSEQGQRLERTASLSSVGIPRKAHGSSVSPISGALDSRTGSSALGFGGPSDWEHFGNGVEDEVDDIAVFASKSTKRTVSPSRLETVSELPSAPSPTLDTKTTTINLSQDDPDYPSPPAPIPVDLHHPLSGAPNREQYAPTPPPNDESQPGYIATNNAQSDGIHDNGTAITQENFRSDTIESVPKESANWQSASEAFLVSGPNPDESRSHIDSGFVIGNDGLQANNSHRTTLKGVPENNQSATNDVLDVSNAQISVQRPSKIEHMGDIPSHIVPQKSQSTFVMDDGNYSPDKTSNAAEQNIMPRTKQSEANEEILRTYGEKLKAQEDKLKAQESQITALEIQIKSKDETLRIQKGQIDLKDEQMKVSSDRLGLQDEKMKAQDEKMKSQDSIIQSQTNNIKSLDERIKTQDEKINFQLNELKIYEGKISDYETTCRLQEEKIKSQEDQILTHQKDIEAAKTKTIDDMQPRNLIPDLDPWYIDSLERYISMLRQEASASVIQDKIKIFTEFIAAQSQARGIDYHVGHPAQDDIVQAVDEPAPQNQTSSAKSNGSDTNERKGTPPKVIPAPFNADETLSPQFSPGGRPLLRHYSSNDGTVSTRVIQQQSSNATTKVEGRNDQPVSSVYKPYVPSAQSSIPEPVVLTPTSSAEGDYTKGTILESPVEKPSASVSSYQAYNPGESSFSSSGNETIKDSVPIPSLQPAPLNIPQNKRIHEEIFFTSQAKPSKPSSPTNISSNGTPLSNIVQSNAIESLSGLLPSSTQTVIPSHAQIENIHSMASKLSNNFDYISEMAKSWETGASTKRRQLEDTRRIRQEESEARTNQLFDDNEIAYADIATLEDEFKLEEQKMKAQEDRDEYEDYVKNVFDPIYSRLQGEIKQLMDLYVECQALLSKGTSGRDALNYEDSQRSEFPTTLQIMRVLRLLHGFAEIRHEKVAQAVAERDRKYKRTEIQPLYTSGNIGKMKAVEKHFEQAEKEAAYKTKVSKSDRLQELQIICEDASFKAVTGDQDYRTQIMVEVQKSINQIAQNSQEKRQDNVRKSVFVRVQEVLERLAQNSKHMMIELSELEVELCAFHSDIRVAKAKLDGTNHDHILQIEDTTKIDEEKTKKEFQRRIKVIDDDLESDKTILSSTETSVEEHTAKPGLTEEELKQARLKLALDEAKKRNGQLG